MTIVLADITAQIISEGGFTYQNLWMPTGEPYDFRFHVDRSVFDTVLRYVRTIKNDDELAALARRADITTSLVLEVLLQAKFYHINMNFLHAGAVCAIVCEMISVLHTPNRPDYATWAE